MFVANYGSSNVTVIDAINNQVYIGNVAVGTNPTSLVDDSNDGLVFVANAGTKAISVITAANPGKPPTSGCAILGSSYRSNLFAPIGECNRDYSLERLRDNHSRKPCRGGHERRSR